MKYMIRVTILAVLALSGCSTFTPVDSTPQIEIIKPAVPLQPVVYTQNSGVREPYTGVMPYVICFGLECDRPTPKRIFRKPVQAAQTAPVSTRIKESIGFVFNTTTIEPASRDVLDKAIKSSMTAREVWIKGFAGLTDTNRKNEDGVMSLALARARMVEREMKVAGVTGHITVGSELVRCQSEDDCLKQFNYGGRRADLEILVINGGNSVEHPK